MFERKINVPVYGNCYAVSTDGVITNLRTGNALKNLTNRYRRNTKTVQLSVDGVSKRFYVHYLVAITYPEICGKWFEGAEVDHINGDCTDNRAENLRFVTHGDNVRNPATVWKHKVFSPEALERLSERMKGENNPAKHYTDVWRRHQSESRIGRKHSDATKEKCRQAMIGRYLGAKHPCSKAVKRFKDGMEQVFGGIREASRLSGIGRESIQNCLRKGRLDKEGYRWAFI